MSKKKRQKRGKEQRKAEPRRNSVDVSFDKIDIQREIRHIMQLAQAGDSRLVTLGSLVLFSTATGDAWLLDAEDDFAACVCRDGQPQNVRVIDAPTSFGIDWPAKFAIRGSAFIVQERTGRLTEIVGYPTVEIAAACRR